MSKDRNALRAGLFIVISIALIIAIIIAIQGFDRIVEPMQQRKVSFSLKDDVGGLRVGDDVRIGGFKVGVVRRIDVMGTGENDTVAPGRIEVSFTIPRKYVLRDQPHIAVQGTLTGTSWLNFDNLGAGAPLPPEVALVGRPSQASELMATLSAVGPEVRGLLTDVRTKTLPSANDTIALIGQMSATFKDTGTSGTRLIEDVRAQVDPTAKKYHAVADRGAEMMVQVRDLIGDTKTDFRGTVANLNAATASVKDKLPGMLDRVDAILVNADKSILSINTVLVDAKTTMEHLRDISATAKEIIGGNRSKIDGMLASLKSTSDNLKGASAEIRRSPWRLLYKPAAGEMANLNIYDSARQFADGAHDLNDAAGALRDALQNPSLDKAEVQKLMEHVEKSFTNFNEVEQKLWTTVKE